MFTPRFGSLFGVGFSCMSGTGYDVCDGDVIPCELGSMGDNERLARWAVLGGFVRPGRTVRHDGEEL